MRPYCGLGWRWLELLFPRHAGILLPLQVLENPVKEASVNRDGMSDVVSRRSVVPTAPHVQHYEFRRQGGTGVNVGPRVGKGQLTMSFRGLPNLPAGLDLDCEE